MPKGEIRMISGSEHDAMSRLKTFCDGVPASVRR